MAKYTFSCAWYTVFTPIKQTGSNHVTIKHLHVALTYIFPHMDTNHILKPGVNGVSDSEKLIEELYSDLRHTIAMTTTAMMKTKVAVADPTMSGSCSCHDFGGSALGGQGEKVVTWRTCHKHAPTRAAIRLYS